MVSSHTRRAAVTLVLLASVGCTIHNTETPALSGPSTLALNLTLNAIPDSINQDGGSQSSIRISAIGPTGKAVSALPVRIDMRVNGRAQDYGTLSARTVVTNSDGVATVVYTAPPSPPDGVFSQCGAVLGNCVEILATPSGSGFETANSQSVQIRLVPPGVILAPAGTPTAAFIFSPSTISANLPINFDASSSQAGQGATQIVSYTWSFGDGTTGTGRTATHTYSSGNNFSVTLTVTNDRGLSASTTQQLGVAAGALPVPVFTYSPVAPGANEPVFFNGGLSTPGTGHQSITAYRWTFGDGGTGSGVAVSHAYATSGTYGVQLTVTDDVGQSATSQVQQVTVGTPPGPTANFVFSPQIPQVNQAVTFDGSTSITQQGQTIRFYDWTFGDGTSPVRTTTPTVSHTFGFSGTFNPNLVVTDSANRTSSKASQIIVTAAVACGDVTLPCASISVSPAPAPVNTEVSFVANVSSVGVPGTRIVNYQWDFGDGSPIFGSSAPNVGYTYRARGSFTAKLTVTNDNGKSSSSALTVIIQ